MTVQGDLTQLNVSTLNVEDKNLLIASGAANASAANGGGITIDGADATILYSSANDSFQLNKQLQVEGNISGSSFGGTTLLSSSNENFADYSSSVDSRLDTIEGPMSTSLDLRLIEIFSTGSDHETRLDAIEGSFSTSLDSRLDELEGTFSSSVDSRLDELESFSSSLDDTFATEAELNSATSSLSASLAVDIASNLSEITNLNSFSESIESHLPSGIISGSDQLTSSYDSRYALSGSGGGGVSNYNDLTNIPSGIVSGSSQIVLTDADNTGFTTNYVTEHSDYVYYTNTRVLDYINGKGVISGSSQVNADSITNFDSNVKDKLNDEGVISGSSQLEGYVSSSTANVIEVMTSASYAAITPVSGTLYIIQG